MTGHIWHKPALRLDRVSTGSTTSSTTRAGTAKPSNWKNAEAWKFAFFFLHLLPLLLISELRFG
jgi:hypothetical protein